MNLWIENPRFELHQTLAVTLTENNSLSQWLTVIKHSSWQKEVISSISQIIIRSYMSHIPIIWYNPSYPSDIPMISVCLSLGTNSSPQLQASQVAYTAVFFVGFTAQCLAVRCDTLQHMRHCQHCASCDFK